MPAELAALERRSFAEPWDVATLAALLARPAVGAWTLDDPPGEALAFLTFQRAADEAEILRLGVPPELRRRGHGRRLLERFLDWARAEGIARLFLEVRESNAAALALYAAAGFRPVGRRPGYYRDPPEDALLFEWRPEATHP